jgi:hypothetical protein
MAAAEPIGSKDQRIGSYARAAGGNEILRRIDLELFESRAEFIVRLQRAVFAIERRER